MPNNNLIPSILSSKNQVTQVSKPVKLKKKLLVWSDCVLSTTGFGVLSKHILDGLYATGEYEIDQLAINHPGVFQNLESVPYSIIPAKLHDPTDPYGNQMFLTCLQKKQYDIVLIINDTFVVEDVARNIEEVRAIKRQNNQTVFNLVYYYPVDCRLVPEKSTMVKIADRSVAYTNFAKESSEAVDVHPTDVIYHGSDIETFKPISDELRRMCRKQYLNIEDDDTFVFVNVNRNSPRKDIPRTILAFSEFRKKVPNSKLYLHCKILDKPQGLIVDLGVPLRELGLDTANDVIFPNKYNTAKGFPAQIVNQLYNCGDAYITTANGEGFGLSVIEAMAAGVPVIGPKHTSIEEILGLTRGYVYECKEQVYIDSSGYRPYARMEDIQAVMDRCYLDWLDRKKAGSEGYMRRMRTISEARKFTEKYQWKNIDKQWVKLFSELKPKDKNAQMDGEQL